MTLSTFPHFSILLLWQFGVMPFLHTCIYSTYLFCPFYYRMKSLNDFVLLFIIYSVAQLNGFCPFVCRSLSRTAETCAVGVLFLLRRRTSLHQTKGPNSFRGRGQWESGIEDGESQL